MEWEMVVRSKDLTGSGIFDSEETERLCIPTGWIVRTIVTRYSSGESENVSVSVSQIHVDDPGHAWALDY